ncbi:hypothetical protein NPIL_48491 [Nephila pilipes]|uniref:Histone-lysine N-methyltransferase SETMAR n=1 Tax=Nephila pilipes TaxID=299642 RepID=A0A8X6JZB6_NEPPI|nr:hypothetical protein NPIL_48491 [Nephila pilipes]
MIHYDFMKPGSSITAEINCNPLDETMQKLFKKQTGLVNRSNPILLHDNARHSLPPTAQMPVSNLPELVLDLLHHPPYSPYLDETNYQRVKLTI